MELELTELNEVDRKLHRAEILLAAMDSIFTPSDEPVTTELGRAEMLDRFIQTFK